MSQAPVEWQPLIEAALQARQRAYAPYSRYAVGAALLTADGAIVTGANVENAVYPLGICAERVAVARAVHEGHTRFRALVVATANGGTPCGACRQTLREFAAELPILIVDGQGRVVLETDLTELLPYAFSPTDLPQG
ncbi:MAG: cytidine deaminase [Chloroflexi bacterium]|nr:cytidine deaminase [Chloroflexota bacterium]